MGFDYPKIEKRRSGGESTGVGEESSLQTEQHKQGTVLIPGYSCLSTSQIAVIKTILILRSRCFPKFSCFF